jgi:signal peptide peptidase SppA
MAGLLLAIGLGVIIFGTFSKASTPTTHPKSVSYDLAKASILSPSDATIAVININGFIGKAPVVAETIEKELINARTYIGDKNLKALVVCLDSGGGFSISSHKIYNAIMQFKQALNVPVYGFIDGICASGAYLIACSADKLYSTPYSAVGSIGSRSMYFFNVHQLMQELGIEAKSFEEGKHKNPLSPFEPWTKDEGAWIKTLIEDDYNLFVDTVVQAREKLSKGDLVDIYGAEVYPAQRSLEIGFVDALTKSKYSFFQELKKELQIEGEMQVLCFPQNSFMDSLFENSAEALQEAKVNAAEALIHEKLPLTMQLKNR